MRPEQIPRGRISKLVAVVAALGLFVALGATASSTSALGPGCQYLFEIGEPTLACELALAEEVTAECNRLKAEGKPPSSRCAAREAKERQKQSESEQEARAHNEAEEAAKRKQEQNSFAEYAQDIVKFKIEAGFLKNTNRRHPGTTYFYAYLPHVYYSGAKLTVKQGSHIILSHAIVGVPETYSGKVYSVSTTGIPATCSRPNITYSYTVEVAISGGPSFNVNPAYKGVAERLVRTGKVKGVSSWWCKRLAHKR
jgi:hypothetical protein